MRMLRWYHEFVSEQIRDLPKGSRSRGWTVFGLWSMFLVPLVFVGVAVAYFLGFYGFLGFVGVLVVAEIVFRMVDCLSK